MRIQASTCLLAGALVGSACHTPAQAGGDYYSGVRDLGHHAGARWAVRNMGVGAAAHSAPAAKAEPLAVDAGAMGDAAR